MLPIGSVVEFENSTCMIVGYDYQEENNQLQPCYIVVPWPSGIVDVSSLHSVGTKSIQLISSGFQAESYQYLSIFLDGLTDIAAKCSADEMVGYLNEAAKKIEEAKF